MYTLYRMIQFLYYVHFIQNDAILVLWTLNTDTILVLCTLYTEWYNSCTMNTLYTDAILVLWTLYTDTILVLWTLYTDAILALCTLTECYWLVYSPIPQQSGKCGQLSPLESPSTGQCPFLYIEIKVTTTALGSGNSSIRCGNSSTWKWEQYH